jgi:hypothetical protein
VNVRTSLPYFVNAIPEMTGAAVGQIITVNTGNYQIFQAHLLRHFCYPFGLSLIWRLGFARSYRTKPAPSRANITQNQDCCRAPRPAFATIGTVGIIAYRLQTQRF